MQCRPQCGACCIAPSISTAIPGMPYGKAANAACIQLDENYACKIFSHVERPAVCAKFKACEDVCGENRDQALLNLKNLEDLTN